MPTATVKMVGPDGIVRVASGIGTGPVDSAYKAIDSLVRVQVIGHRMHQGFLIFLELAPSALGIL